MNRREFISKVANSSAVGIFANYSVGIVISSTFALYPFILEQQRLELQRVNLKNNLPVRKVVIGNVFVKNIKTEVVHWPNSSIFCRVSLISDENAQEYPNELSEMKNVLTLATQSRPSDNNRPPTEFDKDGQGCDCENRVLCFNKNQLALAYEYVSIAMLNADDLGDSNTVKARDFLAQGIKYGCGFSRRQIELLVKLSVITPNGDHESCFKYIQQVTSNYRQDRRGSRGLPECLRSDSEFQKYWDLSVENKMRERFTKSVRKRQEKISFS